MINRGRRAPGYRRGPAGWAPCDRCADWPAAKASVVSARQRHWSARLVLVHLAQADAQFSVENAELAAEELRQAQLALGRITGHLDADTLLGRIFSGFCIGK
jgi:tRNA U34 5-carboxymethylaminomethyl modifying GTPase MnmE/TrmE